MQKFILVKFQDLKMNYPQQLWEDCFPKSKLFLAASWLINIDILI